eukprot:CAMPEP_0117418598 /NCGR_PEP_ID=MMETSP0758-20121206/332_1 /TAXON_ID=63605 /ORGANISM="Percolomonas cosmopolitus, Strain AE-1 (ATCC 50343)" /LENGTH=471 /DNA_ID=CAMNT_0005199167 /DNA_START=376 /DNA_END=1791 /DNA_ORIENTATION=-
MTISNPTPTTNESPNFVEDDFPTTGISSSPLQLHFRDESENTDDIFTDDDEVSDHNVSSLKIKLNTDTDESWGSDEDSAESNHLDNNPHSNSLDRPVTPSISDVDELIAKDITPKHENKSSDFETYRYSPSAEGKSTSSTFESSEDTPDTQSPSKLKINIPSNKNQPMSFTTPTPPTSYSKSQLSRTYSTTPYSARHHKKVENNDGFETPTDSDESEDESVQSEHEIAEPTPLFDMETLTESEAHKYIHDCIQVNPFFIEGSLSNAIPITWVLFEERSFSISTKLDRFGNDSSEVMQSITSGLLVGPWLLYWDRQSSLCIPKFLTNEALLSVQHLLPIVELFNVRFDIKGRMVETIRKWNTGAFYDRLQCNAQQFVDDMLDALDLVPLDQRFLSEEAVSSLHILKVLRRDGFSTLQYLGYPVITSRKLFDNILKDFLESNQSIMLTNRDYGLLLNYQMIFDAKHVLYPFYQ